MLRSAAACGAPQPFCPSIIHISGKALRNVLPASMGARSGTHVINTQSVQFASVLKRTKNAMRGGPFVGAPGPCCGGISAFA